MKYFKKYYYIFIALLILSMVFLYSSLKEEEVLTIDNIKNNITLNGNDNSFIIKTNYDTKELKFISSDPNIASVDNKGLVTPIKDGIVRIIIEVIKTEEKKDFTINIDKLAWKLSNEINDLNCTMALVKIYENEEYTYEVPNGCYPNHVFVVYEDGTKITIKDALDNNRVTISELINAGLKVYINKKES